MKKKYNDQRVTSGERDAMYERYNIEAKIIGRDYLLSIT